MCAIIDFLRDPLWQGVAGIVAILALLLAVVTEWPKIRQFLPRRSADAPPGSITPEPVRDYRPSVRAALFLGASFCAVALSAIGLTWRLFGPPSSQGSTAMPTTGTSPVTPTQVMTPTLMPIRTLIPTVAAAPMVDATPTPTIILPPTQPQVVNLTSTPKGTLYGIRFVAGPIPADEELHNVYFSVDNGAEQFLFTAGPMVDKTFYKEFSRSIRVRVAIKSGTVLHEELYVNGDLVTSSESADNNGLTYSAP